MTSALARASIAAFAVLALPARSSFAVPRPPAAAAQGERQSFDPSWVGALQWRSIGPANMGGRITDIAVRPEDPSTYWVATASGGLLKTTNRGVSYEHQFDQEATVSIGAIAVAPSDPAVVWVGTGEANPRNSVSWGDGVYKSSDGGESWEPMGLRGSFQIGRVLVHPSDADVVWVAALGRLWGPNEERGLFKTTDGGKSWRKLLYVDEHTGVVDIAMHPGDPDVLLAATYERQRDGFDSNDPVKKWGPGSGLYRSTDGGESWTRVSAGLPAVQLGRIGIDWHVADPSIVYAIVETERIAQLPDDAAWLGARTEDAEVGARVTRVEEGSPAESAGLREGDFVLGFGERKVATSAALEGALRGHSAGETVTVEIVREREFQVLEVELGARPEDERARSPFSSGLGGQRENLQQDQGRGAEDTGGVYLSKDAGLSWERVNSLNPRPMYFSEIRVDPSDASRVYVLGISLYRSSDGGVTFRSDGAGREVHVDHHALWIDPDDGRHMILGNDGGIYVTWDRMESWDHHNHVAIGQFYHAEVDNRPLYNVYGGLQDNGSWGGPNRTRSGGGPVNADWFRIGGGDGFVCRIDPEDPELVYYESQNGGMGRIHLGTGERGFLRPRGSREDRPRFNWETPFVLSHHNSRILLAAGHRVYRSLDRGNGLHPISPEITRTARGSATALAESPRDHERLWVGSDDGALWTRDGEDGWVDLMQWPPEPQAAPAPQAITAAASDLGQEAGAAARATEAVALLLQGNGPAEAQEENAGALELEASFEDVTAEDPVAGTWTARLTGEGAPESEGEFTIELTRTAAGGLGGTIRSGLGDSRIEGAVHDAATGELEFRAVSERGELEFEAEVAGDRMEGFFVGAGGAFSMEFAARRTPAPAAPAVGGALAGVLEGVEPPAGEAGPETTGTPETPAPREGLLSSLIPGPLWVASIEASRFDAERVYVALDGHRSDDDEPYVFASDDGGESWRSLRANLPPGSVRVLREDRVQEDLLYLGTEFGAWVSIDRGESWTRLSPGLPTVAVHDFAQHETLPEVVVATHGRSLWVLDVQVLRETSAETLARDAWLYAPAPVVRWRREPERGSSSTREFVGENPDPDAQIWYSLGRDARELSLRVEDLSGGLLRELEASDARGLHRVPWDLSLAGSDGEDRGRRRPRSAGEGSYRVVLEVDGVTLTRELRVEPDPDHVESRLAARRAGAQALELGEDETEELEVPLELEPSPARERAPGGR